MGLSIEGELPHVTEYDINKVWEYLYTSKDQAVHYLNLGLDHYADSMRDAMDKQQDYYYESQSYLQPMAGTALDTMNRMRLMLGMSPMSGYGTTGAVNGSGSMYGGSPLIDSAAKKLLAGQDMLEGYQAELAGFQEQLGSLDKYNLLDQEARDKAYNEVYAYLNKPGSDQEKADRMKQNYGSVFGLDDDHPLAGLSVAQASHGLMSNLEKPVPLEDKDNYLGKYSDLYGSYNQGVQVLYDMAQRREALNRNISSTQEEIDYYNERIPQLEKNLRIVGGDPSKLSAEDQELLAGLKVQGGVGQDPRQALLEQTPGYQFRYEQGLEALQQAMSAQGLTGSGEALERAQEYGQGLAGTYFDTYMEQLGGLLGQTGGALQAQANLASQQGANEANLLATLASQRYNTKAAQSGILSQTGANMANLYSDIAKHNASLATSTLNTLINVLGKGTSAASPPSGSTSPGARGYAPGYSASGQVARGNYTYFNPSPAKYDWVVPGASEYEQYGGGYV